MSQAAHSYWSILNTLLSENEGHPPWAPASQGTDRNADKTITIKRFQTHSWRASAGDSFTVSMCAKSHLLSSNPPTTASSALTGGTVDKVDLRYKCFPEPSPSLGNTCGPTHSDTTGVSRLPSLSPPRSILFRKLFPECSAYSATSTACNLCSGTYFYLPPNFQR